MVRVGRLWLAGVQRYRRLRDGDWSPAVQLAVQGRLPSSAHVAAHTEGSGAVPRPRNGLPAFRYSHNFLPMHSCLVIVSGWSSVWEGMRQDVWGTEVPQRCPGASLDSPKVDDCLQIILLWCAQKESKTIFSWLSMIDGESSGVDLAGCFFFGGGTHGRI